ncbi:hypothetical protein [Deminuibacter soli]|uniref:Uncharacterized protein n=1 Tax=Deminuibacter soli TaxID=2291815 RepID=A0A3E1NMG3_9BACT|nr:hypothetical protein [Deminuibacter soli]RFM29102.1 hypothetical protein DXN05_10130 [Deminuibacter soli]
MKKLLTAVALLITGHAFSQVNYQELGKRLEAAAAHPNIWKQPVRPRITVFPSAPAKNTTPAAPIDAMPVVRTIPSNNTLLGNNGKGMDIYQSSIDGMYIARPDKQFYNEMPVK